MTLLFPRCRRSGVRKVARETQNNEESSIAGVPFAVYAEERHPSTSLPEAEAGMLWRKHKVEFAGCKDSRKRCE